MKDYLSTSSATKKYEKVRQLSREDAIRMIRDNNLSIVHKDKNGTIWES